MFSWLHWGVKFKAFYCVWQLGWELYRPWWMHWYSYFLILFHVMRSEGHGRASREIWHDGKFSRKAVKVKRRQMSFWWSTLTGETKTDSGRNIYLLHFSWLSLILPRGMGSVWSVSDVGVGFSSLSLTNERDPDRWLGLSGIPGTCCYLSRLCEHLWKPANQNITTKI